MSDTYTLGVEEEYQLVDPQTRALCGRAGKVFKAAAGGDRVQRELHNCQIEIATDVCGTLTALRQELRRSRQVVIEAASDLNVAVVAAGTHPFSPWQDQTLTDKARYQQLAQELRQVIRELIIFGCHVHVGLNDTLFHDHPAIALDVVNRCRLWLAPLLALTANSPFWQGSDTGYDSYRTALWSRLPTAGPPPHFADYQDYQTFLQTLVKTEVVKDATHLYWDIRLSESFPTIEFRIADVCTTLEDTVMLAGLVKALVRTCYEASVAAQPYAAVPSELLTAAHWTAARYGLSGHLIDLDHGGTAPAQEYIQQFLEFLRPALRAAGDWEVVNARVQEVLVRGNGATRQRRWYQTSSDWQYVVDQLIQHTAMDVQPQSAASALSMAGV